MKNYFNFEWKIFLKKSKTSFMILVLLTFFGTVFYSINQKDLGSQEKQLNEELNQTRILSQYAQQYNEENEEEFSLGTNINQQQSLLASQANGLTFNNTEWYLNSGIKLAELRLEMQESDSFSELPVTLLPKEDTITRDLVKLKAIEENSREILKNAKSSSGFVQEALSLFGLVAFGYLLLFGNDLVIDDFEHETMLKSYPVTPLERFTTKLVIYSVSAILMLGVSLGVLSILTSLYWNVGDFSYPIGLYLAGQFQAVPLWQYVSLYLFYYFILSIHTFLLVMVLNHYLKNSIGTMIIGMILYTLPYLLQSIASYLKFLPFHYYNLGYLFDGRFGTELSDIMDLRLGAVILLVYSLFFILIIIRKEKLHTQNV